jgi:TonB family protein
VRGSLDPAIIRRVIRMHRSEAKYCYEKDLVKKPKLAGKIVVGFTVSPEGRVSSARVEADTMGSAAVANCLVGRVKRWRFPKPEGGGIVVVSYPFVFKAK